MDRFQCKITLAAVVLLCALGQAVAEPISPGGFHARVITVYSFHPHTIGKDAFPAKSVQLDEFWAFVTENKKECLPLLRVELSDRSNPSFFFYDGAKLILSLSKESADQQLALQSLPRADLQDVQEADYLATVHELAAKGFDTREAAFRILAFPEFKAFFPQHVLTLGQNFSFIYLLFPMPESTFVNDLSGRLRTETDVQSQKSLMLALWYTVTPDGVSAIERLIADPTAKAESVKYGQSLLARQASPKSPSESLAALRSERQKVMQAPISDEALEEFDALTLKILSKK